jgi:hypothetical protein|nr:hypothetical protein [uncultured Acetatifactor sp.]
MVIKEATTIAEYAIRRWLLNQGFAMEHFKLSMDGDKGYLEDRNGDMLTLVYDGLTKSVYISEEICQPEGARKVNEERSTNGAS